jgi:hypothetical protein
MLAVVSLYVPMNQLYTVQGLVLRERKSLLLQSSVVEWRSKCGGAKMNDLRIT